MIRIEIKTQFDITSTGTTGHFKLSRVPSVDQAGNSITDQISWNRSRNQQRNYETLLQLLSLRTQIFDVTLPVEREGLWSFELSVESAGIFGEDEEFSVLRQDADGIPMLLHLDNSSGLDPMLVTQGDKQNIWFAEIAINTTLENKDG